MKLHSFSRQELGLSIRQIVEEAVDEGVFPERSELVRSYARHHMRRFSDVVDLIQIPRSVKIRILDVGIAYGFYDIALKKRYNIMIDGVDLPDNIPSFCGMLQKNGIQVKSCDLTKERLPFADETFDVVIFSEVIEHLRVHPITLLRDIRRVLKTEGYVIISTPNVARLTNVFTLLFGKNVFEEFKCDLPKQAHITDSWTHIREYTLKELSALIHESDLEVDRVRMSRCWNGFDRVMIRSNSRLKRFCALIDSVVTLFFQRYRACIMIRAKKL